jgi:hypothetical protein
MPIFPFDQVDLPIAWSVFLLFLAPDCITDEAKCLHCACRTMGPRHERNCARPRMTLVGVVSHADHVHLCDGFRMPARTSGSPGADGRRSKAARERSRGRLGNRLSGYYGDFAGRGDAAGAFRGRGRCGRSVAGLRTWREDALSRSLCRPIEARSMAPEPTLAVRRHGQRSTGSLRDRQ